MMINQYGSGSSLCNTAHGFYINLRGIRMTRIPIAIISSVAELLVLDKKLLVLGESAARHVREVKEKKRLVWKEIEKVLESKDLVKDANKATLYIRDGVIFEEVEDKDSAHPLSMLLESISDNISITVEKG
jgi:Sec-independent protein translocase protein TatA